MASMGLKYLAWAKQATEPSNAVPTYDAGKVIGRMVSANLAIQSAELKRKYVKNWTIGAEVTNKDISADITHKNLGITVGYTWKDKDLRIGPRYQTKF